MSILVAAITSQSPPTLLTVYEKVRSLPGVEIQAEMVSPSNLPFTIKISPKGLLWSKYPTNEMFVSSKKTITWMSDSNTFSESASEDYCPTPVGFESMWPGAKQRKQLSPTTTGSFQGKSCYLMDCSGDPDNVVHLYVDKATLLPYATSTKFGGKTYEAVFKSIKVRKLTDEELEFKKPIGAKPAVPGNPNANIIKPGITLKNVAAVDFDGRAHSLKTLLRGSNGLVLNFWFAGCTGCELEMPFLKILAPKLAKRGIKLVGVDPIDQAKYARSTSKKHELPYPTLIGPGAIKLRKQVKLGAYPVTLILDRTGKVVDVIEFPDENLIKQGITKLDPNWES